MTLRSGVLIVLVGSTIYAGAERLAETARLARELARLENLEARRAMLFGSWYPALQQLRRATPEDAAIDLVMLHPDGRDVAVLAAAELQPRDVRLFDGWENWRQRKRAVLMHDARAANAAPGPPPPPARHVVIVDARAEPPLRFAGPLP